MEEKMQGQVGHSDFETPVEMLIGYLEKTCLRNISKECQIKPWVQNKSTEKHKALQAIFEENCNLKAG